MIEILIIIAVVRAFMRMAGEKGYSKGLWAFIGAFSYYGPILLTSLVIYPLLVLNGTVEYNEDTDKYKLILINLIVGISCCAVAYFILKRMPAKNQTLNQDILDTEIQTGNTTFDEN